MALPFATSQLVRYVTDRVLENVVKQMARPAADPRALALPEAPPDLAAVLGSLNTGLLRLQRQLEELEERFDQVDRRFKRLERRWDWRAMAKVVLGVVAAFVLGFALAYLLRLGGWLG